MTPRGFFKLLLAAVGGLFLGTNAWGFHILGWLAMVGAVYLEMEPKNEGGSLV